MGTFGGDVQPSPEAPVVAFDFDGTLTSRDSFMTFLRWRSGPVGFSAGLARLLPATLAYGFHHDRGRLKAAAVRVFLKGLSVADLSASALGFSRDQAPRLMRPDAVECWRTWSRAGARLIIVTASPELLVAPFGLALGAERVIGTRLATDARGRLTGAFDGANCRGAEKVARLAEALGRGVRLAAAYGDTTGDREMLAIAEEPGYRVFREKPGR